MIDYRGAKKADYERLAPLAEAYARERAALTGERLQDDFMAALGPVLQQVLDDPFYFTVLALDGDRAVGYGAGLVQEPHPMFAPEPLVTITDLYVLPEYRRRGIGTALAERVRGWGLIRGAVRATMVVPAGCAAAHRIAQRLGFAPTAQVYGWQVQA